MADRREVHITAYGNKIVLEASSNDCEFEMSNVLDILCRTIAGIYLETGKEGTRKEEFADAIGDSILRILTAETQGNIHYGTK